MARSLHFDDRVLAFVVIHSCWLHARGWSPRHRASRRPRAPPGAFVSLWVGRSMMAHGPSRSRVLMLHDDTPPSRARPSVLVLALACIYPLRPPLALASRCGTRRCSASDCRSNRDARAVRSPSSCECKMTHGPHFDIVTGLPPSSCAIVWACKRPAATRRRARGDCARVAVLGLAARQHRRRRYSLDPPFRYFSADREHFVSFHRSLLPSWFWQRSPASARLARTPHEAGHACRPSA